MRASEAPKARAAAELFDRYGIRGMVHMDGGVNRDTAELAGAWGADVCIVGSALFQRGRDTADEVTLVRERVARGRAAGPPPDDEDTGAWRLPSAADRA